MATFCRRLKTNDVRCDVSISAAEQKNKKEKRRTNRQMNKQQNMNGETRPSSVNWLKSHATFKLTEAICSLN